MYSTNSHSVLYTSRECHHAKPCLRCGDLDDDPPTTTRSQPPALPADTRQVCRYINCLGVSERLLKSKFHRFPIDKFVLDDGGYGERIVGELGLGAAPRSTRGEDFGVGVSGVIGRCRCGRCGETDVGDVDREAVDADVNGAGLCFGFNPEVSSPLAEPFAFDVRALGPLIVIPLGFRGLSRGGDAIADAVDDDDANTADRELGDGTACDDKCSAGDDTDACRKDGGMNAVRPDDSRRGRGDS